MCCLVLNNTTALFLPTTTSHQLLQEEDCILTVKQVGPFVVGSAFLVQYMQESRQLSSQQSKCQCDSDPSSKLVGL